MRKVKHKVSKKNEFFKIKDGKIVRERKSCPKCGSGVFLANHKDRLHCGRCGYAEFLKV
ncbi:MAG: 30S ribosomal protein S27ae [Candidatus Altiarchaeota archaeon]|nr:30S ribosomal protein S27ae [Candidatus Altiarchaeota archaeon]